MTNVQFIQTADGRYQAKPRRDQRPLHADHSHWKLTNDRWLWRSESWRQHLAQSRAAIGEWVGGPPQFAPERSLEKVRVGLAPASYGGTLGGVIDYCSGPVPASVGKQFEILRKRFHKLLRDCEPQHFRNRRSWETDGEFDIDRWLQQKIDCAARIRKRIDRQAQPIAIVYEDLSGRKDRSNAIIRCAAELTAFVDQLEFSGYRCELFLSDATICRSFEAIVLASSRKTFPLLQTKPRSKQEEQWEMELAQFSRKILPGIPIHRFIRMKTHDSAVNPHVILHALSPWSTRLIYHQACCACPHFDFCSDNLGGVVASIPRDMLQKMTGAQPMFIVRGGVKQSIFDQVREFGIAWLQQV